jgi:hypothetical protein
MSRGSGWVQKACLGIIQTYEARGEWWPTTLDIAAEVYHVKPDDDSSRLITDAQHVAVRRALEGLQRKGRVIGFRTNKRCYQWMTEKGLAQWIAKREEVPLMCVNAPPGLLKAFEDDITRIANKAKAIGMSVDRD